MKMRPCSHLFRRQTHFHISTSKKRSVHGMQCSWDVASCVRWKLIVQLLKVILFLQCSGVQDISKCPWRLADWMEQISAQLNCSFQHILREANDTVDHLVREGASS